MHAHSTQKLHPQPLHINALLAKLHFYCPSGTNTHCMCLPHNICRCCSPILRMSPLLEALHLLQRWQAHKAELNSFQLTATTFWGLLHTLISRAYCKQLGLLHTHTHTSFLFRLIAPITALHTLANPTVTPPCLL